MTTRPGYVWDATASEWVEIGQAAVVSPFKYQATAPSSPATGDIWIESDVDVPSIDSAQFLRWRKTMAGGETSLSGNDDSSLPLRYTPGYEQLYINGVLQVRGQDYTATTGTTVTGLTALAANDVVEIFSAVARTVADVYTQTQSDARFVNKNVGGLNLVIPTSATNGTVSANGQISFTASSTIQINGCFSSTYDNYLFELRYTQNTATGNLYYQNSLSGTPVAGTGYSGSGYSNYAASSGTLLGGGSGISKITIGNSLSGGVGYVTANISSPALAATTLYTQQHIFTSTGAGGTTTGYVGGSHGISTAYDGMTLTLDGGTITGTIRIYGYNNGA